MKVNLAAASTIEADTLVNTGYIYILGGTERLTGESFLVEVQQIRDVQTLLSIIQQYVRPGSVVDWSTHTACGENFGCL